MNDQQQATAATGGLSELAQVQQHAVELLGKLGRHPSNLRIQVGEISVDITWAPEPSHDGGHHRDGSTDVREALAEGAEAEEKEYLTSPAVGVFYHAKEPGGEPFVAVGTMVQPGQQIGIVEAMKLMIPVEADRVGIISDVLKANGAPVEYDEPLFAVETTEA